MMRIKKWLRKNKKGEMTITSYLIYTIIVIAFMVLMVLLIRYAWPVGYGAIKSVFNSFKFGS